MIWRTTEQHQPDLICKKKLRRSSWMNCNFIWKLNNFRTYSICLPSLSMAWTHRYKKDYFIDKQRLYKNKSRWCLSLDCCVCGVCDRPLLRRFLCRTLNKMDARHSIHKYTLILEACRKQLCLQLY